MRIIYNKFIPFPGYCAMTVGNWIFAREEYRKEGLSDITINHEKIHMAQAHDFGLGDFGYVIFYLLYLLEWIFKLPVYLFGYNAYSNISFEQEAYTNQNNLTYLNNRKKFEWTKYIFKLKK